MREIFGVTISTDSRVAAEVKHSLDAIRTLGIREALDRFRISNLAISAVLILGTK